ncbi:polyprenyl diphosphate synthase, partial [Elusimicrobiota bacterium]
KAGVKYLSLFAFSNENWKRPSEEVSSLMDLLVKFLRRELNELKRNNVRLLVAGRKNFSKKVIKVLDKSVKETENNTSMNLVLCLDYGGRQEIVDTACKFNGLTEEEFSESLYLPDVPDIDLLIRTSGEERISNYMLWRLSYSELYFTDTLWPDFDIEEMKKALKAYNMRSRRFGMRI